MVYLTSAGLCLFVQIKQVRGQLFNAFTSPFVNGTAQNGWIRSELLGFTRRKGWTGWTDLDSVGHQFSEDVSKK